MSSNEQLKRLQIPLQHISSATKNFAKQNYIGLGGFWHVYKGESKKYGTITVKRLDCDGWERGQVDGEFQKKIDFHSIYKHENIVSLLGFCNAYDEKILVYKYESNGSLHKHLKSPDLTWTQRLQICLGAARGLKYLHHDVAPEHRRMLHRDVKSANILLDENWNAKISYFGLSKKCLANNRQASFVISKAIGTLGCIDPEYLCTGHLTQETDVFSFGIVLFEVLSGRPAFTTVDGQFFFVWVKEHYIEKRLDNIICHGLHEQINPASLLKFSAIAYRCLKTAKERPTMAEVVEQLQKALDIQLAPSGPSSDINNGAFRYSQFGAVTSASDFPRNRSRSTVMSTLSSKTRTVSRPPGNSEAVQCGRPTTISVLSSKTRTVSRPPSRSSLIISSQSQSTRTPSVVQRPPSRSSMLRSHKSPAVQYGKPTAVLTLSRKTISSRQRNSPSVISRPPSRSRAMSTLSRLRNSPAVQYGNPTAVLTLSRTSTESRPPSRSSMLRSRQSVRKSTPRVILRPHNMTSSIWSSKSSLSSRIHDVFLSFRGQDTGMTFVKRLHSALVQQRVYKDPQGESVGPYLFKAIQESKIAIIIFTTNYADSDLCLNELEYIMKCKVTKGLVVIPIFLHVDPSDVRTQKRMYGVAFSKHKSGNIDKVESWRKALVDAANLAGFVVARDEENAIQEIVYTITHTYLSLISSDNATAERRAHTNLIGIETRMQDLRSLLESVQDGVRMVGISGIWGGGKSALASSIYDEINHEFEGFSYVQNVRTESTTHGLKTLQEKILSDLFKTEVTLRDTNQGMSMMTTRLSQNSVLIVLDDVDNVFHLDMLAASLEWFGDGSLIIITSRNQDLVNAHNCITYNVRMLDDEEAIELFSWNAFGASRPEEGYEELSQSIVSKLSGHPATLKNLGSFLHGKDKLEWTSALAKLEDVPVDEILEKVNPGDDGVTRNTFSWLLTRGDEIKDVAT